MATSISMCSNALLMIGHGTISSFTEGGSGAEAASNLYDSTYESLLSAHRWRFAAAKSQLSQLTDTPLNDWTYAYQLPSGYLMGISVYPNVEYEIYEDKLYSDSNDLAAQFAIPVTGNRSLAEIYTLKFESQLKRARFADSQSRPQAGIVDSPFIEARA
jgi:hypothetical protein